MTLTATVTKRCPRCGEDVEISGTADVMPAAAGFKFTSDDAGTRAAWNHQAKHDAEDDAARAREAQANPELLADPEGGQG